MAKMNHLKMCVKWHSRHKYAAKSIKDQRTQDYLDFVGERKERVDEIRQEQRTLNLTYEI